MSAYNLTFMEAIEKCLNGEGFIRGEGFQKGIFIENRNGTLYLIQHDGDMYRDLGPLMITQNMLKQRFKIFEVANKKELELK